MPLTLPEKRLRNRSLCTLYTPPPYPGYGPIVGSFTPSSAAISRKFSDSPTNSSGISIGGPPSDGSDRLSQSYSESYFRLSCFSPGDGTPLSNGSSLSSPFTNGTTTTNGIGSHLPWKSYVVRSKSPARFILSSPKHQTSGSRVSNGTEANGRSLSEDTPISPPRNYLLRRNSNSRSNLLDRSIDLKSPIKEETRLETTFGASTFTTVSSTLTSCSPEIVARKEKLRHGVLDIAANGSLTASSSPLHSSTPNPAKISTTFPVDASTPYQSLSSKPVSAVVTQKTHHQSKRSVNPPASLKDKRRKNTTKNSSGYGSFSSDSDDRDWDPTAQIGNGIFKIGAPLISSPVTEPINGTIEENVAYTGHQNGVSPPNGTGLHHAATAVTLRQARMNTREQRVRNHKRRQSVPANLREAYTETMASPFSNRDLIENRSRRHSSLFRFFAEKEKANSSTENSRELGISKSQAGGPHNFFDRIRQYRIPFSEYAQTIDKEERKNQTSDNPRKEHFWNKKRQTGEYRPAKREEIVKELPGASKDELAASLRSARHDKECESGSFSRSHQHLKPYQNQAQISGQKTHATMAENKSSDDFEGAEKRAVAGVNRPASVLQLAREFSAANAQRERRSRKMERISHIVDATQLQKMLTESKDGDERGAIRARLQEIRSGRTANGSDHYSSASGRIDTVITNGAAYPGAAYSNADGIYKSTLKVDGKENVFRPRGGSRSGPPTPVHSRGNIAELRKSSAPGAEKTLGGIASLSVTSQSGGTNGSMAKPQPNMFKQMERANSAGPPKTGFVARSPSTIKEALLRWCQVKTSGYENVNITNFSSSWADGMAFAAIVHHYRPNAFDFSKLDPKNRRENLDLAFRVADEQADIMPLLEVDDMLMMGDKPDWKCVFTYVQSLYKTFRSEEVQ